MLPIFQAGPGQETELVAASCCPMKALLVLFFFFLLSLPGACSSIFAIKNKGK